MAELTSSQDLPKIYVGVGVGSYEHSQTYPPLKQAIPDVEDVGKILAGYGYQVQRPFADPDRSVGEKLEGLLAANTMARGGYLVVFWSGHGERAAKGGVNLIVHNTKPGSAALFTPEYLADVAARTGASEILLILDTCFSGGGVMPAATVADVVWLEKPPAAEHFGFALIASSMDYERSKDGVFGARIKRLLSHGPEHPEHPELRRSWSPENQDVEIDAFVNALDLEWDDPGQRPKEVRLGVPRLRLPNPLYRPAKPVSQERMDTHLLNAARGGEPGDERNYFSGRRDELDRIVAWMQAGKPGAFVVTGPTGIGKSAILGRIVSLSNYEERTRLLAQGPLEHGDPGKGSVNAHVHSLRYSAERLVAAIDDQLVRDGLFAAAPNGPRNRIELHAAIRQSGKYPVIVVDGLDESGPESWRIAESVLRTLSEVSLVLISAQDLPPVEGPLSLVKALGAKDTQVLDLGETAIQKAAESDVRRYVDKRLAGVAAPSMDVAKVVDIILEHSREQNTGAFLLARFVTTQLRIRPVDTSSSNWEKDLIRSIEQTFEESIAGIPPLRRDSLELPQAARELLEALAWAKGPGLPDDVWPIIATALSPTGTRYEASELDWLLPQVGRYIIEDGQSGRAVYRLVHQCLSDHFQPVVRTRAELGQPDERAVKVARALVDYYQALLDARNLPQMPAYLWRYAWQHCADAGEAGIGAFRPLLERDYNAFAPQLALALSFFYRRQAALGLWQDASRAAEEAVGIYRRLIDHDPALRVDLAEALVAFARLQGAVGQPQTELAAAREAADLLKTMDTDNPAVTLPLASALSVLSLGYDLEGRLQETVQPASEAVSLLRKLSSNNPAFAPDLAPALTTLGLGYSLTGQAREAVGAAKEAVDLFRTIDTTIPELGLMFAWALTVLGQGYSQTGQPREAVDAARQAVALTANTDTSNPAVGIMLASALTVLGQGFSQTGQSNEAVGAAKQAAELLRTMEIANPAVRLMLATALTVLGRGYSQSGQNRAAVDAAKDAAELLRTMDAANPAVPQTLASALTVLSLGHFQSGRLKEAVDAGKEAVDLLRTIDTANPALLQTSALALTVLGLGYFQSGQPKEALEAAQEAVAFFRTTDTTNPAVAQMFASALTVLALGHSQSEQPKEALEAAREAVALFRTLDITIPTVAQTFASALTVLGLGYLQTEQPKEALDPAKEAVDLLRTMDTAKPPIAQELASALGVLGQGYLQDGQAKEAVAAAEEAVALFTTLDTANPMVALPLASALSVLGLSYSRSRQPKKAVDAGSEAVRIYGELSASNPALLAELANQLESLGDYYREAGQEAEISVRWEAAVDSRKRAADKAFLLLRRVSRRDSADAAAVPELIRANSYLTDSDRELTVELHALSRSRRAANPAGFDAAWRGAGGSAPPRWLTLEPSALTVLWEWIIRQPTEAARDYLREHIGELPPDSDAVALDEIALIANAPSVIEPYRELLKSARELGVDEAYRPLFPMRLLFDWMSADWETKRVMLAQRRDDLLGEETDKALQSLLAGKSDDPQLLVHKALLDLARSGRQDLAFAATTDAARARATLLDLARADDINALDALATVAFFVGETEPIRAQGCFYESLVLALQNRPDDALAVIAEARRLDPAQVDNWLSVLVELAARRHNELIALSQALVADPKAN